MGALRVSARSQHGAGKPACPAGSLGRSAGLVWLCFWISTAVWSGGAACAQTREPVAVVAGEAIYEEDLLPLIKGQMLQIRRQ
ncbi:MAG: Thioredoxin protein, partial [Acidobacteria bacterium]|nr:Thioredoxin protein [Acidobacteriota bacterium]